MAAFGRQLRFVEVEKRPVGVEPVPVTVVL